MIDKINKKCKANQFVKDRVSSIWHYLKSVQQPTNQPTKSHISYSNCAVLSFGWWKKTRPSLLVKANSSILADASCLYQVALLNATTSCCQSSGATPMADDSQRVSTMEKLTYLDVY
jgi:hypothetical protein